MRGLDTFLGCVSLNPLGAFKLEDRSVDVELLRSNLLGRRARSSLRKHAREKINAPPVDRSLITSGLLPIQVFPALWEFLLLSGLK